MTTAELLKALEASGFVLELTSEGGLRVDAPPGEMTPSLQHRIESSRQALVVLLQERQRQAVEMGIRLDAALAGALVRIDEVRRMTKHTLADSLEAVARHCHTQGRLDDLYDMMRTAERVLTDVRSRTFALKR